MKPTQSQIALRIYFLERALEGMEQAADDAECDLLANPTDASQGRQLGAFYVLADETWRHIQMLRARLDGAASLIYFDSRLADPDARAARQALI
ncbi:hypothetical protein [Reyranella sp.]|uniref:hypothetical protein n=1 Tax=Reyranella sp. TaxID=1929291 RepID=UPI003BACFD9B